MAYGFVQSASVQWNAIASGTLAYPSGLTAGNFLAIGLATFDQNPSSITWSVGASAAPTLAINTSLAVTARGYIYYAPNAAGGAHTLSLAFPAATYFSILLHEYSGIVTASPLNTNGTGIGTGTGTAAAATTSGALDQTDNLIFAVTTSSTGGALGVGAGTTDLAVREEQPDNSNGQCGFSGDKRVTSTAAVTATFIYNPSNTWKAAVAAFKEAAAAPQDTPELYGRPAGLRGQTQLRQLLAS